MADFIEDWHQARKKFQKHKTPHHTNHSFHLHLMANTVPSHGLPLQDVNEQMMIENIVAGGTRRAYIADSSLLFARWCLEHQAGSQQMLETDSNNWKLKQKEWEQGKAGCTSNQALPFCYRIQQRNLLFCKTRSHHQASWSTCKDCGIGVQKRGCPRAATETKDLQSTIYFVYTIEQASLLPLSKS